MRPHCLRRSIIALVFSLLVSTRALGAGLDLQTFRTHSRLLLEVDASVEPRWKDLPGGFEILLPGLDLVDVPHTPDVLGRMKDVRLKGITLKASEQGVVIRGEWSFPSGDLAPADPRMERFQYREANSSRLVVDFWIKEGPTVGELRKIQKVRERDAAVKRAEQSARKRQQRRQELEKILRVQEDVSRFCREPFKDGEDVFLPFLPYHEVPDLNAWLPEEAPDEDFRYLKAKEGSPDAQYVNLAHDLYQNGKFALTVRTIDFFEKEQPQSRFRKEMQFLKANAFLKLGQVTLADRLFQEIRENHVGHPIALHSAIYLMHKMRKEGNHLGTVEESLWIANHYPSHRLAWVFHLIAAESLYALRQTDRAVQAYEAVVDRAPTRETRALASVRIGDAHMARFQYDRALAAYFKASELFPTESGSSPSLQINRAEALYWLGQYERARDAFRSFGTRFSGHPAGWRAELRMGEVVGRDPGPEAIAQSRKHFLNTINHFPFSPGATLARLRLIPCGDHGGFTEATARDFFENEARTFKGGDEISMERYFDLRAMHRVRGMILLSNTTDAIDAALEEKESLSPKSGVGRWIRDVERQLFRKGILGLIEQGKGFDAIKFYDQRIARIDLLSEDEDSERAVVDPDYLLRLSRIASDLGMGKLAQKIADQYEKANAAFVVARGIASTATVDLDERLRQSERFFTLAKAAWVSQGGDASQEIREALSKVIDESPFSFQREIILGLMDQQAGKGSSALRHALGAKLLLAREGAVGSYSQDHAIVDQWIVKLQLESGQTQLALQSLRELQGVKITNDRFLSAQLRLPQLESREEWIIQEAGLLEKSGRWGEAAVAYEKLVKDGKGGNRALVQMAFALEKTGRASNIARSGEILKKVSESPSAGSGEDFWKELARKAIAGRSENAKEGNE